MEHPEVFLIPVLMISDYYLTILCAFQKEKKYDEHFRIQHFELNCLWQKDIARKRLFNPRHLTLVLLVTAVMFCGVEYGDLPDSSLEMFLGLLTVIYGAIIGRHLLNLLYFRRLTRHPDDVSGQVTLSHQLMLRISCYQLLMVALPIAIIAVFSPSPFVCVHGFWMWRHKTKRKPSRKVILVVILGLILVYVAVVFGLVLCSDVARRQEIAALPAFLHYEEKNSRVPELFGKARARVQDWDIEGAEAVYQEIVRLEPNSAAGYVGLGTCRFFQKDLDGAESHYRRALESHPRFAGSYIGLGAVALERNDYETAEEHYQNALDLDADPVATHWGLALAYEGLGNDTKALEHWRSAARCASNARIVRTANDRVAELQNRGPSK